MQQDDERMGVPFQTVGSRLETLACMVGPCACGVESRTTALECECSGQTNGKGGSNGSQGCFRAINPCPSKIGVALNLDAEYHNQQLHMGTATGVRQRAHRGGSMGWHGMMDTQSGRTFPFSPWTQPSCAETPRVWSVLFCRKTKYISMVDGQQKTSRRAPWTLTSPSMAWKVCTLKGNARRLESHSGSRVNGMLLSGNCSFSGGGSFKQDALDFHASGNEVPIRRAL